MKSVEKNGVKLGENEKISSIPLLEVNQFDTVLGLVHPYTQKYSSYGDYLSKRD